MCKLTGASAFLYNQGDMHFFTNFQGKKPSPLFWFYITLFKVPEGFQTNSRINDILPVHLLFGGVLKFLQDFAAPVYMFLRAEYQLVMKQAGDIISSEHVRLETVVKRKAAGRIMDVTKSNVDIFPDGSFEINLETDKAKIKMICRNVLES
jgi:hypothetical protein